MLKRNKALLGFTLCILVFLIYSGISHNYYIQEGLFINEDRAVRIFERQLAKDNGYNPGGRDDIKPYKIRFFLFAWLIQGTTNEPYFGSLPCYFILTIGGAAFQMNHAR
jgi:hypothetical protein